MSEQLTREQVLAMKPGRELDLLVAKIVMGVVKDDVDESLFDFCRPAGNYNYSSSISAAWEVVEKMYERGFTFNIHMFNDHTYNIEVFSIRRGHLFNSDYFKTAPEAICKASLLAVMGL